MCTCGIHTHTEICMDYNTHKTYIRGYLERRRLGDIGLMLERNFIFTFAIFEFLKKQEDVINYQLFKKACFLSESLSTKADSFGSATVEHHCFPNR